MPTLLIKNVSEELLEELKRLKVELGCKTWAELLEKLVRGSYRGVFIASEDELRENMRLSVDPIDKLPICWGRMKSK